MTTNSFDTLAELDTGTGKARFHSLARLERAGFAQVGTLPRTIKVLLEAALRGEDGLAVREEDVVKLAQYNPVEPARVEIPFKPARVLLQDFTGVPGGGGPGRACAAPCSGWAATRRGSTRRSRWTW